MRSLSCASFSFSSCNGVLHTNKEEDSREHDFNIDLSRVDGRMREGGIDIKVRSIKAPMLSY